MILLLLTSLFLEFVLDFNFRNLLQPFSQVLQDFCVGQFEGVSLKPLASALVCGKDLSGSPLKNLFIDTGLYHILVVSGAHLSLLMAFFTSANLCSVFLRLAEWIQKLFPILCSAKWDRRFEQLGRATLVIGLIFYSLTTGLQAPVVRALIQFLMMQFLNSEKHVRPIDVLFSYIYCLAFNPAWIRSLSLELSTVATLAFIFPLRPLAKNFVIYMTILPLILPLGIHSPAVILIATFIGPLLELFLLPFFIVVGAIQALQPLAEIAIQPLLEILSAFRDRLPPPVLAEMNLPKFLGPFYVLILWLVADHFVCRSHRRWHFARPSNHTERTS